jgi:hypothetical protein
MKCPPKARSQLVPLFWEVVETLAGDWAQLGEVGHWGRVLGDCVLSWPLAESPCVLVTMH